MKIKTLLLPLAMAEREMESSLLCYVTGIFSGSTFQLPIVHLAVGRLDVPNHPSRFSHPCGVAESFC